MRETDRRRRGSTGMSRDFRVQPIEKEVSPDNGTSNVDAAVRGRSNRSKGYTKGNVVSAEPERVTTSRIM